MNTYIFLQQYWWFVVSLLGAILVFLLFVQGGNSLIFYLGKTEEQRKMIINSTGRKWEFTFTTLVTFGGAFFASFPLFYSTSFGGAYWVWMAILFCFVLQAVSYEFQSKPGNVFGRNTYRWFLFCNGLLGTFLVGAALATFFTGSDFTVNKGNIIYLDQYVDHVENIFFMRIEWELESFLVPQEKIEDYFETLYAQKYGMSFRLYFSDVKPRMAIFVSKMSHCLFDLLARYTAGEWNVEIPLIISNHPDLQHVAERFGIPFHLFPITKETKEEQEKKEMELLAKHKVNFIVLARYMQVISEKMIDAYPNRIINIHHSFLPAFVGAKPYHAAFERGVKIIGATSHYVTTELDAGPIIEQDVVRITHKDTVQDLVNKGKDLEKIVLSRAVQKHIERKVLAYKNKTVIFN